LPDGQPFTGHVLVKRTLRIVALACLCQALPFVAFAQDVAEDPADLARFRFGPIRFTPVIQIRNVGVDTNVFNQAQEPERDFTASIGPAVDYWARLGRARIHGKAGLDYNYFQEFKTQRSLGTENELRAELPLNRLKPFLVGAYDNTRRRPDYEIDIRTRYRTTRVGGGIDVRALSRTVLRLEADESRLRFDEDVFFFGTNLGDALDRRSRAYRVSVRQSLTPLTTFVVQTERQQDRFDVSADRDADSYRIMPGFELDPRALISGRGFVGYRSFTTLDADVPDYNGIVALVEAVYALRATKFGVAVQRDAWYSYELTEPFFIVTDLNLEVTQKVTTNWDMVGRVGHQLLNYQKRVSIGGGERTDTLWRVGGGVGRRVGRASRIGFDIDRVRRDSPRSPERGYEGWRIGGSLTYGVQGS
jgi:hypothetical protein